MNRFFEEVDPVAILVKAKIAGYGEKVVVEKKGDKYKTTEAAIVVTESQSGDGDKLHLFNQADEKLEDGLQQPNQLTLVFKDPVMEEGYRLFHNSNHLPFLAMFGVGHVANVLVALGDPDTYVWEWVAYLTVVMVVLLSLPLLLRGSPLRLKKVHSRAAFHEWACMVCGYTILLRNLATFAVGFECDAADRPRCVATAASDFLVNLSVSPLFAQRFYLCAGQIPIALGFTVVSLVMAGGDTPAYVTTIPSITVPLGTLIFLGGMVSVYERSQRRVFSSSLYLAVKKLKTQAAHDQASGVMATLLPLSVLKPVVRGESVFHTAEATVVQADVCNFTKWCSSRNSTQVVEMLSSVMSGFDEIATGNQCTRIKVLGDGYIACAGLPDYNKDHAECGVKFALAMQAELTQCCVRNRELKWGSMEVRAGVHSGQVSAGVLSKQRWAYDIYGEIPNIANILEPAANDGAVLVSETTFNLLPANMQKGRAHLKQGPSFKTMVTGEDDAEEEQEVKSFHLGTQYLIAIDAHDGDGNSVHNSRSLMQSSSRHTKDQGAEARVLLMAGFSTNKRMSRIATGLSVLGASGARGPGRSQLASSCLTAGGNTPSAGGSYRLSVTNGVAKDVESVGDDAEEMEAEADETTGSIVEVAEEDIPLDLASDPTEEVYAQMTQTISLASLMCVVVGLLAWGLAASNPTGTEIEFLLCIVALVVNGICQCVPSTAGKSVIVVTYVGLSTIVIFPLITAAAPFSMVFFGNAAPYLTPFLPYRSEALAYSFFAAVVAVSSVTLVLLSGEYAPSGGDLVSRALLVGSVLCILRFLFMKRIRMLKKDAHETSRQLWHLKKEKEALEMVLRLKMPNHVVDGLFAEDAGDVLNASYVIPSCLIAFAHFKLPPELLGEGNEGVNLDVLYAMTRVIDAVLPTDGSGKLRHLEKIKTIGDVVMMGGSVIPGQSQYVSDEEVLVELLYVMEDIGREIKGEELLADGCQCLMGVHKGEVTTATIGTVNLEYDVFGTAVNTAARLMASTDPHNIKAQAAGKAPRVFDGQLVAAVCSDHVIQVLDKLKAKKTSLRPDLVTGTYEGTDGRTFVAKGIGEMTSYVLSRVGGRQGVPSSPPTSSSSPNPKDLLPAALLVAMVAEESPST